MVDTVHVAFRNVFVGSNLSLRIHLERCRKMKPDTALFGLPSSPSGVFPTVSSWVRQVWCLRMYVSKDNCLRRVESHQTHQHLFTVRNEGGRLERHLTSDTHTHRHKYSPYIVYPSESSIEWLTNIRWKGQTNATTTLSESSEQTLRSRRTEIAVEDTQFSLECLL